MGVELETVHTQPQSNEKPKTIRISRKVKRALEHMAFYGKNRKEAAETVGLKEDSLYKAMTKSDVKTVMRDLQKVLRESEAHRSIARIAKLADDKGESGQVRLNANVELLGLEGIGSKGRESSNPLIGNVNLPGLTIVYQAADRPGDKAIDISVPHPSLSKPEVIDK